MDGKIFSFDLQRFDNVWSIGSDSSSYVYGPGATSFASLKVAGNNGAKFWSLGGGSSDTPITLDLSQATGAADSIISSMRNEGAWKFDASKVTGAFSFKLVSSTPFTSIEGGNHGASIDASAIKNGVYLGGGSGTDLLKAGSGNSTLDGKGGTGDSLVGNSGVDYFVYGGSGTTSIGTFTADKDFISLTSDATVLPGASDVSTNTAGDLVLNFGTSNSLSIAGASASTVKLINFGNGNVTYYYSAGLIDKGHTAVSLTAAGASFNALDSGYSNVVSIDASGSDVTSGVNVTLNNKGNYVIGSGHGNSIYGGTGADFISLSGSDTNNDIFYYKGGADSIVGFGANDSVSLTKGFNLVTDGNYLESIGTDQFKLSFDSKGTNTLTFQNPTGAVSVYGSDSGEVYQYTSTAISIKGAENGNKVTLGSSFKEGSFTGTDFSLISAAAVSVSGTGFKITADSIASDIYGSDKVFTSIMGSSISSGDTLSAGAAGASLNGNGGNDLLIGSSKKDYFYFASGKASIQNYTYSTVDADKDIVSIADSLTVPTSFVGDSVNYGGSDYVVSLGGGNSLTFKAKQKFALAQGESIYTYAPSSIALAVNGTDKGITIGGDYYTSKNFNGTLEANADFVTINASEVDHAIKVTGNDKSNYMLASSLHGGTLLGGAEQDTLQAGSVGAYMDGGDGNVLYIGSNGEFTGAAAANASLANDTFVYRGNAASIQNYAAGDIVDFEANDIAITDATVTSSVLSGNGKYNISLNFGGGDAIIFQSLDSTIATQSGVSLQSGRNNLYVYNNDRVTWNSKSITLTADYAGMSGQSMYSAADDATLLATIDAHLVGDSIEGDNFLIKGNASDNYIIGSKKANTILGGGGNDTLVGNAATLDVFQYTAGKDVIVGFDDKDRFSIGGGSYTPNSITKAKTNRNSLTFTIDKSNTIAFRASDNTNVPEMVSLSGGGYLTANGVVSSIATSNEGKYSLKLFSSAKGTIELANYTLTGGNVTSVNAAAVTKQGLTLVAKSVEGTAYYDFYKGNKKRDTFEYDAGAVSISGFESGKDRLNIVDDTITSFSIHGGTNKTGGDVIISLNGGTRDIVSLNGAQGNEILVRANGARSYSKMVFREAGVLENKTKNPTSVTLSTGAASYSAENNNVKKITVTDIGKDISIFAGAKGSVIDASNAKEGVSIIGGAKADKFTGSAHTDTFVFNTQSGGKDIFNGFVGADNTNADAIEFSNGNAALLSDAKISASNKAVKFKFGKNTLTLKGNDLKDAQLQIAGTEYSYGKNAIINGDNVSLTSAFGGTYKVNGISTVDGHLVTKNLMFKVTTSGTNETLMGGTKKTTFKGAGGNDTLQGGTGADTFFYAKGDAGTATITDFDFTKDKLKIASGTLRKITVGSGGELTFNMSAKNSKDDPEIGHFNIQSFYNKDTKKTETLIAEKAKKTLIHANNKYYWFAQEQFQETVTIGSESSTITIKAGDLITWSDKKLSSSQIKDYDVIELSYGTNLVKSGVATLVSSKNDKATLPNNSPNR